MDQDSTQKAICMLTCLPNGVQVMSADIPGLVQTSLNLGVLATGEEEMRASFCVRSSVESRRSCWWAVCPPDEAAVRPHRGLWRLLQLGVPGDSPLRELMTEVYREQYGKEPSIELSTPAWSAASSPASCPAWTACPSVPTCWRSTLPGSA